VKGMKPILLTMLVLMTLLGAGCGGDVTIVASTGNGVVVVTTETNPTIVLAQFVQDTSNRIIFGRIDYHAPFSAVGTMTISVTDANGTLISRTVSDLAAFQGIANGTIPFTVDYATYPPGTYTVTIFVTNVAGYLSNPVFRAFGVQ
jgi:hypothetical protein